MLPGYHNLFRVIAGKNVLKSPDIPKENLAVEEKGEETARLPLSYKFHSTGIEKKPFVESRSYSDVQTDKTSPVMKWEDFPKEGYLGEGVYYE